MTDMTPVTPPASIAAQRVLDPMWHPDLVDQVFLNMEPGTQWPFHYTNQALQRHLNPRIYGHVVLRPHALGSPTFDPFPGDSFRPMLEALNHCRTLDIPTKCQVGNAAEFFRYSRELTVRTTNEINIGNVHIAALVLKCVDFPSRGFALWPSGAVEGPRRLVFNVTYLLADKMFATDLGFDSLPKSVTELVIHLKKFDSERPRYTLCREIPQTDDYEVIAAFGNKLPLPEREFDESIGVISIPGTTEPPSMFDELADMFVAAVGGGEVDTNKTRDLKLTIVGLEEFDRARDADAAGDEVFANTILPLIPGLQVTRAEWAQPEHHSLADTFVGSVLERVHVSKHKMVRANLRLMNSGEYYAQLPSKHRRDEEDWWSQENIGCSGAREWGMRITGGA